MKNHTQQTLALAGVAQAAFMVHQLGQNGIIAQDKLDTAYNSLFITNPKDTAEVYGKTAKLNLGLQVLQEIFQGTTSFLKSPEVMRYIIGMIYLERHLSKRPSMLSSISKGLEATSEFHKDKPLSATDELTEKLDAIYQSTISGLPFRIQVQGKMNYLKNPQTAAKIRAILLAGIRSAVLWQQLGGRRWHLVLYRKRISRDVTFLLSTL